MAVKPIPEGYHSVTPYLIVDGAAAALEFYRAAFGAQELFRLPIGDRTSGNLVDPFGHRWTIATHVEDVPPEEMKRRMEAWSKGGAG